MQKLMQRGEIAALTGVRGIAAVWVVMFHFYPSIAEIFGLPDRSDVRFIDSGFLGVDLFFILSGFIMSYVHGRDFPVYTWAEHKRFLLLRACRVYPLHLVCLAGFAGVILLLPGIEALYNPADLSLTTFVTTALLVQNWGIGPFSMWNSSTWSLSAEMLGYMVFPFILLGIRRYVRPHHASWAIVVVLTVFLGVLYATGYRHLDSIGKTGVIRMLAEFTTGCLLHRQLTTSGMRLRPEAAFWVSILILAVATWFIALDFAAVFGLTLLIAALAVPSRSGNLVFANSASVWLGKVSFSLYLCHLPVLAALDWYRRYHKFGASPLAQCGLLAACILLMLQLSFLLWKYVEMPSRTRLRRWIKPDNQPPKGVFESAPAQAPPTPPSAAEHNIL